MKVDTICIAYRAKNTKTFISRYIHRDTFIKIEVLFIDQFAPKYKLIKDIIYHILGGYNVHDGLHRVIKDLDQIIMHVRVVGHQEAWLHGAKIMPGLDLHRG